MAKFRSLAVTNTSTNIKTTGAEVSSVNIINSHSAVIYVKFYNQTVATFQDTPVRTVSVPASGGILLAPNITFSTSTGLCVRVTTGSNDNDNTAAATLPIIEVEYT